MSRPKSKVHRPNGMNLPMGDIGGEYCVKCRLPWPCPDAPAEQVPNVADCEDKWKDYK